MKTEGITIDKAVGSAIGYVLRHPNGDVVREGHGVPIGFMTRRSAAAWLRAEAERERRQEEYDREMEEAQRDAHSR